MLKPENVVNLTAYLTREGIDTLNGTLNLLSDTTADITFSNDAAGGWHLKGDASDEENAVVHTGETEVNILAGRTAQVYLTLEPNRSRDRERIHICKLGNRCNRLSLPDKIQ